MCIGIISDVCHLYVCIHMGMCTTCLQETVEDREDIGFLGIGVTGCCELSCGASNLNLRPQQEQ